MESFAALETALRDDQDAIFTAEGRAATDFIGFVWLMLAIEEDSGTEPEDIDVADIVDSTLAATLSGPVRAICLRVARAVQARYISADQSARRRWPRTGTSIGSAQSIDDLAQRLARTIVTRSRDGDLGDITAPGFLFRFPGVLRTLLGLPEAPTWRFRVSKQGADIEVRAARVLRDWLSGASLAQLAETHLAQVPVPSWRIEQMVDAVTSHFEHYLSWTVGALVELINMRLADVDFADRLCPDLGGYIRFGVDNADTLILMTGGIRSRRLVHAIAADLPDDFETSQNNLRHWLAGMGIAEWRDRYDATASEILDLLGFTRLRRRSLLRTLLEDGTVSVDLPEATITRPRRRLRLQPARNAAEPAPLAVYAGQTHLATIASQDHADVSAILDTGLAIDLAVDVNSEPPTLTISLPLVDTE